MVNPPAELRSWKEVAAYLGVSVRTAQTWEREHGLPVHRGPGSRPHVWAEVAAVNAWRRRPVMPAPAGLFRFRLAAALGSVAGLFRA